MSRFQLPIEIMAESKEQDGSDKGLLLALRSAMTSIVSQKHFMISPDCCTELQVFGKRVLALSTIDRLFAHNCSLF